MSTSYSDLQRHSRIVVALLVGSLIVDLVSVGVTFSTIAMVSENQGLSEAAQQSAAWTARITADAERASTLFVIWVAVHGASAVAFLSWFYRLYKNITALGGSTERGHGWAIGAWFVPILSLWRPYHMTKEVWRSHQPEGGEATRTPRLIGIWWAAWVVDRLTSHFGREPDTFMAIDWMYLSSKGVTLVTSTLAVVLVLRITAWQRSHRARQMGGAQEQRI